MKPNASTNLAGRPHANLRTRREAIRLMGLAGTAGCAWMDCAAAEVKEAQQKTSGTSDAALDEAYQLLQRQEPRCKQGLSTHAPMAAEALCALGHCDRAVRWVE